MTSSLFVSLACSISVASIEIDVQMRKEVDNGNRRDFGDVEFMLRNRIMGMSCARTGFLSCTRSF